METKLLEKDISFLSLNKNINERLKENNIYTIKELCSMTKSDLRELSLEQNEINNIEIHLQLNGLDIKKKRH